MRSMLALAQHCLGLGTTTLMQAQSGTFTCNATSFELSGRYLCT